MKCLHMANSHLSINLESQEMLKPFRHGGREERKGEIRGKVGGKRVYQEREREERKTSWNTVH